MVESLVKVSSNTKGLVFDIQRYSIHDGPGIRSIVFFKGCPLNCKWCSNPESQSSNIQLFHSHNRCKLCGRCVEMCPKNALSITNNEVNIDRNICDLCGTCIDVCLYNNWRTVGKWYTVKEIIHELLKDEKFFVTSGGGITIGGGEPFQQKTFLKELLEECNNMCLNTAVETCGYVNTSILKSILPFIDILLMDLKHMDEKKHLEWTGVSNKLILKNWEVVANNSKNIICRIPVLNGFNNTESEIKEILNFIVSIGIKETHFIQYHRMGEGKYKSLGLEYMYNNISAPTSEQMEKYLKIAEEMGLIAQIGG